MDGYQSVTDADLNKYLINVFAKFGDASKQLAWTARDVIETGTGGEPFDPNINKDHGPGLNPGLYRELGLDEERRYFAVRNSELKLVSEVAVVLSAAVAAMATAALPVASLASLFILLHRFRKKRIELTWKQGLVLETLKHAPSEGWTTQDVWEHVVQKPMDIGEIETCLQKLKDVRQADNTFVSLVSERSGRWWAADV